LERNLRLLRLYALLTYPFVCIPFLFLFFSQNGLDLGTYGTIITVYYATMFVADVPTSIIADRIGHRMMLTLGSLLLACGFALLWFWRSLTGFCLAEALMGLGHSVLSGPPSAMLYELLRRHGQEHRYLREESRIHSRRLMGTGLSFLLGGFLAWGLGDDGGHAYSATILPTAALCALAGLVALLLPSDRGQERSRWRAILQRARSDLRLREVRWLLAYWIVLFALLRYPFHVYQVYLDQASRFEPWFGEPLFVGALYAVMNLFASPLSRQVPRLVDRFGRRTLFWSMPLLLGGSIAAMGIFALLADAWPAWSRPLIWCGVLMFFCQQIPFGMHWGLVQEFVNHRIQPEARSTVWSVLSLGGRASYAPVNKLVFQAQQALGTATVLSWAGALGLGITGLVMAMRPRGALQDAAPSEASGSES
jgi:Na+/melibiose symporter-like transporter